MSSGVGQQDRRDAVLGEAREKHGDESVERAPGIAVDLLRDQVGLELHAATAAVPIRGVAWMEPAAVGRRRDDEDPVGGEQLVQGPPAPGLPLLGDVLVEPDVQALRAEQVGQPAHHADMPGVLVRVGNHESRTRPFGDVHAHSPIVRTPGSGTAHTARRRASRQSLPGARTRAGRA